MGGTPSSVLREGRRGLPLSTLMPSILNKVFKGELRESCHGEERALPKEHRDGVSEVEVSPRRGNPLFEEIASLQDASQSPQKAKAAARNDMWGEGQRAGCPSPVQGRPGLKEEIRYCCSIGVTNWK